MILLLHMKMNSKKNEIIIDAIGIIVFALAFVNWLLNDSAVNKAGTVAAVVSVTIFVIICINFVHEWMSLWNNDGGNSNLNNNGNVKKVSFEIFLAFLVYDVLLLFLIHFIRIAVFKDTTSFIEGLNLFLHIDTGYYLKIAEQWYVTTPEYIYDLVFYPAYPIAIKIANIAFNNYLISATVVSAIFYGASASMLYKMLILDYDHEDAMRGIKYFAILPAAFFFAIPMSESMFIFLSISSIYCARKDRWLLACVIGALSAFTRSLGVLIFAPLVFIAVTELINDKNNREKWSLRLLLTIIVPLGTGAYLLINYITTGDAFAFSTLEYEKWGQSMGWFFDTTAFQIDNALADIQQPYFTNALGIWFPNVAYCFAVLILMAFASKNMRPDYTLWFICYYAIAIGATYLISAPRYLVACLPIYPAVVQVTKNRKTDLTLTICCIVCAIYYIFAFTARWEVF